ncbi:MAG: hypothetical protein PSX36_04245 [bacterium]|nr:hypothetical protein [bacterium]
MKRILLFCLCIQFSLSGFSQGRNINKLTLETTYSYAEISKTLRDQVDATKRENYFNDDFFNGLLKKVLLDKNYSAKEKVQLFYLMQKKLGYAFVGVNYLPPKQNYYVFHLSKIQVMQKTKDFLSKLMLDPTAYIQLADSHKSKDPIISSNALLLATMLNSDKVLEKLHTFSQGQTIMNSKNPTIFNHYMCLSASLVQDSIIAGNLKKNLYVFKQEAMIEDLLCALYSKIHPMTLIRDYILSEKNPENDLSIETALCVLNLKVPEASFRESIKSVLSKSGEPWKTELLTKILEGKIPYNYSLTSPDLLSPKVWDYVQISIYNDGTLISNNTLLEFDAN